MAAEVIFSRSHFQVRSLDSPTFSDFAKSFSATKKSFESSHVLRVMHQICSIHLRYLAIPCSEVPESFHELVLKSPLSLAEESETRRRGNGCLEGSALAVRFPHAAAARDACSAVRSNLDGGFCRWANAKQPRY